MDLQGQNYYSTEDSEHTKLIERKTKMKTRKIIVTLLAILLVIAFSGNALASNEVYNAKETQVSELRIVSKSEYDKLDEKQKDEYLTKYCAVIEDSINTQMKDVYKTFIDELTNQKEFTEVAELNAYVSGHKFTLNIKDVKVRSKLEQSLQEPVVFKDPNPFTSSTRGQYLEKTDPGYFAYAGRTISHSVYSKVYTTTGTWDGHPYKTYDISKYIYSWSGNSSYQDRIDYAWSGVVQYDARTSKSGTHTYNTGWPDHYYSASFSQYASGINLNAGCHLTDTQMGGASSGVHAKAVFSNGSVTHYDDVKTNWGAIVWYYN